MNSFTCCIPGNPVALQRPRFSKWKGSDKIRVYDSQKMEKMLFGINLKEQYGDRPMMSGPLQLDVMFYMPMPSVSNKRKCELYDNNYRTSTPDLDNLIKMLCDECQYIIYPNDSFVVKLSACKVYSFEPRVEFTFTEIGDAV